MARCEDCIHYFVCDALIEKGLPWNDGAYPGEAFCMAFQNKADVAPKSEVEKMQECIYDLYVMLDKVIESAKRNDLSMLRPFRGASGCDAYQGSPPICRAFDELLDKHIEVIFGFSLLASFSMRPSAWGRNAFCCSSAIGNASTRET